MSYVNHADLGGQDVRDAIAPEPEGDLFHAAWEPRVLALTLAMGGTGSWNIDQSRSARETLPGYRDLSYYQVWLAGLERLMAERDLLCTGEIEAGHALQPAVPVPRVLAAERVLPALAAGSPTERPTDAPARFAIGDRVRTRSGPVDHHTRLPGYASGKVGTVERVHGAHVFAESNSQGLGEQPQRLYTVVFDGHELWGDSATPGTTVSVDAWQSTLEAG